MIVHTKVRIKKKSNNCPSLHQLLKRPRSEISHTKMRTKKKTMGNAPTQSLISSPGQGDEQGMRIVRASTIRGVARDTLQRTREGWGSTRAGSGDRVQSRRPTVRYPTPSVTKPNRKEKEKENTPKSESEGIYIYIIYSRRAYAT